MPIPFFQFCITKPQKLAMSDVGTDDQPSNKPKVVLLADDIQSGKNLTLIYPSI